MKIGYLLCRYYPLLYYPVVLWAYCGNYQPSFCKKVVRPVHALLAPFVSLTYLPKCNFRRLKLCSIFSGNVCTAWHFYLEYETKLIYLNFSRDVQASLRILGRESQGLGCAFVSVHLPNWRRHLPLLCERPGSPPRRVRLSAASGRWLLPRLYHNDIWVSNWGEQFSCTSSSAER